MAHYLSVYRLPHFYICTFSCFFFLSAYLLIIFPCAYFYLSTLYYFIILAFIHFHVSPPFVFSTYFSYVHKSYPLHYIFINCQLTLYNFSCTFFTLSIFSELSNVLISLSFQFTPHQMFFLLILWLPIIVLCLSTTVLY